MTGSFDEGVYHSGQPAASRVFRVHIKQSKTDPFRQGIHLFVRKTEASLCPVAAMLAFLVGRREVGAPLFVDQDGRYSA